MTRDPLLTALAELRLDHVEPLPPAVLAAVAHRHRRTRLRQGAIGVAAATVVVGGAGGVVAVAAHPGARTARTATVAAAAAPAAAAGPTTPAPALFTPTAVPPTVGGYEALDFPAGLVRLRSGSNSTEAAFAAPHAVGASASPVVRLIVNLPLVATAPPPPTPRDLIVEIKNVHHQPAVIGTYLTTGRAYVDWFTRSPANVVMHLRVEARSRDEAVAIADGLKAVPVPAVSPRDAPGDSPGTTMSAGALPTAPP